MSEISFTLKPLPPFRLDFTVWVLRRRPDNIWDQWDGRVFRRVLVVDETPVFFAITQTGPAEAPELKVFASGSRLKPEDEPYLISILKRLLGLGIDLTGFYRLAAKDSRLNSLAVNFWGIKPPRYPSVFEALVNAITCQQFTLTAGIRLLGRLVLNFGVPFKKQTVSLHAFPRPEDLTGAEVEDLRKLGYSRQKAHAVIELARMVVEEGLALDRFAALKDSEALEKLTSLRGVGRWTAEYALLRGLGRIHIFPGDDVGVRNRLQDWMKVGRPLDYDGVNRLLNRWKPYGGLIYFHLLLKGLDEAGNLSNAEFGMEN
ncbi:MAG: DNA-3-methyladenine glycosylase 2 family protein [Syntrophaceae bacterium]|nr:DNA-3-methyladenine glycosylase 2 family protein [Syntrophaceae bacterium]